MSVHHHLPLYSPPLFSLSLLPPLLSLPSFPLLQFSSFSLLPRLLLSLLPFLAHLSFRSLAFLSFNSSACLGAGQTVDAFPHTVLHALPLAVGVNCSLGATDMRPYVEELSRLTPTLTICYPNAA
jgi:hypothetical protein